MRSHWQTDNWCEILHTRKTKNVRVLLKYVKAAVKTSPYHGYDTTNQSPKGKSPLQGGTTLPLHASMRLKDENIGRTTISDFTFSGWSTNNTLAPRLRSRKNRSQLAWGGMRPQNGIKRDMNRRCPRLTLDLNYFAYIPCICSGRLRNWPKSSQGETIKLLHMQL